MTKVFKLRKKEVPYVETQAPVERLAFYPENPRIYSQFAGSGDRTQENIQEKLEGMDHVRELRSQIDRDGQVNEPLFCIPISSESELRGQYDYQVLEGNSRLAALRMNKRGSLPPSHVACNVFDFFRIQRAGNREFHFFSVGPVPHQRQDELAQLRERSVHLPAVQEPWGASRRYSKGDCAVGLQGTSDGHRLPDDDRCRGRQYVQVELLRGVCFQHQAQEPKRECPGVP